MWLPISDYELLCVVTMETAFESERERTRLFAKDELACDGCLFFSIAMILFEFL